MDTFSAAVWDTVYEDNLVVSLLGLKLLIGIGDWWVHYNCYTLSACLVFYVIK